MGENMKRFMMSVSDKMFDELERERNSRRLETVQEVTRQLVADYLRRKDSATENVSEEERARTAILGPSKKH
jgi:metal-responsive CopG/Arc/MetJ family transcriptional regulator